MYYRLGIALSFLFLNAPIEAGEFRELVAPILQQRCLACHNSQVAKGGYSLETKEQAFLGHSIVAGDAAASHLAQLIVASDPDERMPKNAKPLSKDEVAIIRKWIDAGAAWPAGHSLAQPIVSDFDWWSYKPIESVALPDLGPAVSNPIDRFVLRKQKEMGLGHNPSADRRTLIRRLTYDLTGLPPTPEEIESFVTSTNPRAYDDLVDRLLASEHYGERWAQHWLDVVKYADTCGYDKDKLRPNAWPYRDYVIRSFNEDKSYGQFIEEQIAGDLLYPNTADGILGLGFLAAGPWDFIGHVEVPESKLDGKVARNLDRDDIVSSAINTFCSLTVQCARCHHHKFDPITQQDYYGLQAIFAAVDRADRVYDIDPKTIEKRKSLQRRISSTQRDLAELNKAVVSAGGRQLQQLKSELAKLRPSVKVQPVTEHGYHSSISKSQVAQKWVAIEFESAVRIAKVILQPCHDDYNNIGAGFGFPLRFKVDLLDSNDQWKTIHDQTQADFLNPGVLPVEIPIGKTTRKIRVVATKLAERKSDFIFAIAELRALNAKGESLSSGTKITALDSIEAPVRWRKSNLIDGKWPTATNPLAAAKYADASKRHQTILSKVWTAARTKRKTQLTTKLANQRKELKNLPTGKMVYAAATEFKPQGNFKPTNGQPRTIHVLHRGNIDQPNKLAAPALLPLSKQAPLPIVAKEESGRRAALAKWLSSRDHPLVWRSIVNRVWQHHFGNGIVDTPNDFGRMGALPTHPELLDWLAADFRDNEQSLKRLHRLIVTSQVYQQSSTFDSGNANKDKDNRFLWRMNRRRLSAEEIRDSILAVTGCLDKQAGGPGFYLFKLEKTQHSPHYEYHKYDPTDASTYRRSVYRFVVRSQPDPWMATLDCADSSQSTPKRTETLTALQALSLMNNRFNLEMSKKLAARLGQQASSTANQLHYGMQLVTGREPSEAELRELTTYAKMHGMPNACRVLLNLSEFFYLD